MDLHTAEMTATDVPEYVAVDLLAGDHVIEPHACRAMKRTTADVFPEIVSDDIPPVAVIVEDVDRPLVVAFLDEIMEVAIFDNDIIPFDAHGGRR